MRPKRRLHPLSAIYHHYWGGRHRARDHRHRQPLRRLPTPITLPFPVTFYGTTFTTGATLQASSNGSLDFVGTAAPFGTSCPLPDARIDRAILPFQGDLY